MASRCSAAAASLLRALPSRPLLPRGSVVCSSSGFFRSHSLSSSSAPGPSPRSTPAPPSSTAASARSSIDPSEIEHFSRLSSQWWDERGELALLHKMNPPRLAFIREKLQESRWREGNEDEMGGGEGRWLEGMRVLDVGCGAGLLSESLARLGASTLGIDATPSNVPLAQAHSLLDPVFASALSSSSSSSQNAPPRLEYRHQTAEDLLKQGGEEQFDLVCAMEVIEHVDDPRAFLMDLCQLVKPGGHIMLSTISRTLLAHALTVTLAETVLSLVSAGTHNSSKFIKPSEMEAFFAEDASWADPLRVREARGVVYLPWKGEWELVGKNVGWVGQGANYLYSVRRPREGEVEAEPSKM